MLLRPPSSTLTDTLLPYPSLFRPAVSSRLRAIFERLGEVPDPGPEVGMEEPAVDLDTYRTLSDEASALDRERVEARRKIDHITSSEERRVGKACVVTCRSRGLEYT